MSILLTFTSGTVVEEKNIPTALVVASPQFGVLGSVVKLDGRSSSDPDDLPLTFTWSFVSVPIGSKVEGEGFRTLDPDMDVVSFSPDLVGEYVVGLTVSNGLFSSQQVLTSISIRALLVPHGRGIIPDGKFIWSYIRDIWTQVEGREWFETLWSALIQLTGNELLKLYQADFNKSIRDIQDLYQRRWLSYEPKLALVESDLTFFLGNHMVGSDASTGSIGVTGLAIIFGPNELIVYSGNITPNVAGEQVQIQTSQAPSNIGSFTIESLNPSRSGYRLLGNPLNPVPDLIAEDVPIVFAFQSTNWNIAGGGGNNLALSMAEYGSPLDYLLPLFNEISAGSIGLIRVGDIIHYPTGPNAGFYRIVEKSGTFLVVDKKPPSFSDVTTANAHKADIYRPVSINIPQPDEALSDTVTVEYSSARKDLATIAPGRLLVVGGQAFTILRTSFDVNQRVPLAVVTTTEKLVTSGLKSQYWRIPHTLVSESQNFEELGVSTGDLMIVDVVREDLQTTTEIVAQVVGVDQFRLGFVLTDEPVLDGEVPPIPNKTFLDLSTRFGLPEIIKQQDGSLFFTSTVKEIFDYISSGKFQREYWNTELDNSTVFTAGGFSFTLHPRAIYRNRLVPVDEDLRSIPVLQEFIVQPTTIEKGGKFFQVHKGQEFELKNKPAVLGENFDYIIDSEFALDGELTFRSGTNVIEADDADFVDRGVGAGDLFIIDEPLTLEGQYLIQSVENKERLTLARDVPLYVLSEIVTAKVRIQRKREGHFLRFVPGTFTANRPAPARLWAEVSFFDNSETIENNFGILVALSKADLDNVSTNINYRQAVAGLMFAFTKGSSIDRVRLGAQILLGLPFTEHRGIIRSIEENYRLNIEGEPVVGRILIEDVDSTGQALGTQRVYTYPVDLESELAGIETNPATEKPYAVGDTVDIFQPLVKGVVIDDYISNPLDPASFSSNAFLQQYHTIRVRINDNIFGLEELDLVSSFLKKITPSYIAYAVVMTSEFVDFVAIDDRLIQAIKSGDTILVDNASFSIPPALMFDSRTMGNVFQMRFEEGVYTVRRTGNNLTTAADSTLVTVPGGGITDPKSNEDFEAPLTKAGDELFIFSGPNMGGPYLIGSVPNDTQALCTDGAPTVGFQTAINQRYAILRKITSKLLTGTAATTSGDNTVALSGPPTPALRTNGVAPGDWIVISDGVTAWRYTIRLVKEGTPGTKVWDRVEVVPAPAATASGLSYTIYRPTFFEAPSLDSWEVESDGNAVLVDYPPELGALCDVGDELLLDEDAQRKYMVLHHFPLYTTPPLPSGIHSGVRLVKKNRPATTIAFDHVEKYDPTDVLEMALVETANDANCTNGSDQVSFSTYDPTELLARPGDFLVLTSGGNSTVDVGHGPGVYPIRKVTLAGVFLTGALTASGPAAWKILRRR